MYRREWSTAAAVGSQRASFEPTDREGAVAAVRAAVRAGILNDLGSGSHVDICCIDRRAGFVLWREPLRVPEEQARETPSATPNLGRELVRFGASPPIGLEDADCAAVRRSDIEGPHIYRLI